MTEPTQTPKPKHTTKQKKAKTTENTNVTAPPAPHTPPSPPIPPAPETPTSPTATPPPEMETQPATQPQPQPQRLQDAIKAHQNAIDFIHTALHRTDCAIQLLTRNGYFTTAQHLQQAKVYLRESEHEAQRSIERIKSEMTRPNV